MPSNEGRDLFIQDFEALDRDVSFFISARLFDGKPVNSGPELDYVKWRHNVAVKLGVDPICVQLVGSARLGYSLSPNKNFKLFDDHSDIDIAVVSSELFDQAWSTLRKKLAVPDGSGLLDRKNYLRKLVFDECIALDIALVHMPFGEKWLSARDKIARDLDKNCLDKSVSYRLYRNHSSLRNYQFRSVSQARDRIIENGEMK